MHATRTEAGNAAAPTGAATGEPTRVLIDHDTVHGPLLEQLAEALADRGFEVTRGAAAAAAKEARGAQAQVVVTTIRGPVNADTMDAMPALHTIVTVTIGTESIDAPAATARGIAIANGATWQNHISMAEATALFVLALLYRLPSADMAWSGGVKAAPASMLARKTVGLVGFGRIAQALVPRLAAFDCKVLVHSRREGLVAEGASFVPLPTLLGQADVVCVLGALDASTRHSIGRHELALMKASAYLVNTARGGLVDEAALIEALEAGRLAGVALDTFDIEPLPADSPLRALNRSSKQVILTPHCIGHTHELAESLLPAMISNIESARDGRLPPTCKNLVAGDAWRRLEPLSPDLPSTQA